MAHAALDEENRKIEFQKEVIISLLTEGQVEMSGLDAMQAISQANQAALAQHQTQLGERRVAQADLAATGGETQTQAAEGASNSSSTAETIGGFMGRFMEMLNIVPSRVVPEGGDGIGQVASVTTEQHAVSGDANATAANAVNAAGTFTTQTETAQTEATADAATLTALDAQVEQERPSAMDRRS